MKHITQIAVFPAQAPLKPIELAVLAKAEETNFGGGYGFELSRNSNSGYTFLYSEDEMHQIAINDSAFNRGEEVEFIISCPETGEEFFGSTLEDVTKQYEEHCEFENI
tara:strand:- start:7545 stop:7868 length:324 start_codon:yes stop_codon:yes gene_type:complete